MDEHDRLSRSAGAGGVVVQTFAGQVDELTAHRGKMTVATGRDKLSEAAPRTLFSSGVPVKL